jgi:tetratricopeptide (TPR) repeat protein
VFPHRSPIAATSCAGRRGLAGRSARGSNPAGGTKLVDALIQAGKGGEALRRAGSIAERASAAGDVVAELYGRIKEAILRVYLEPEGAIETLATLVEQAMPVFQAAEDDLALHIGYHALAQVAFARDQSGKGLEAVERAAAHARRAGVSYEQFSMLAGASVRLVGITPVPELLAWLDEQEARGSRSHHVRPFRAHALAMLGRFDEARAILTETRAELAERGGLLWLAVTTGHSSVDVELLAGDPASAVEFGEEGFRLLDELGEKSAQSYTAAKLAQALYTLDRLEEAEAWADRAAELGATDAPTRLLWGQVRGKVLARRGEHAEAQRLAREAVTIGDDTDFLSMQGDAHADLAEVLLLGGKPDEAHAALEQALDRYERKGNLVSANRTETRLVEIRGARPR